MPTKALLLLLLGFALMGCASTGAWETVTRQTVAPVPSGQGFVPGIGFVRPPAAGAAQYTPVRKVAIFPLADYSQQQPFIQPLRWGGNHRITEAIADRFIAHGITVTPQEDVDGLLLAEGIIRPMLGQYASVERALLQQLRERTSRVETPEYELAWGLHDEPMRDELEKVIKFQDYFRDASLQVTESEEPQLQGVTTALPEARIVELGKALDVDLIIRGRILEYGLSRTPSTASVVQIRLYAQSARTGELIWSNRGEVRVEWPWSLIRRADPKTLFDQATQALVNALMADLFGGL